MDFDEHRSTVTALVAVAAACSVYSLYKRYKKAPKRGEPPQSIRIPVHMALAQEQLFYGVRVVDLSTGIAGPCKGFIRAM